MRRTEYEGNWDTFTSGDAETVSVHVCHHCARDESSLSVFNNPSMKCPTEQEPEKKRQKSEQMVWQTLSASSGN